MSLSEQRREGEGGMEWGRGMGGMGRQERIWRRDSPGIQGDSGDTGVRKEQVEKVLDNRVYLRSSFLLPRLHTLAI